MPERGTSDLDHRLDCRIYARHLSGRLQRHQSLSRFISFALRAELKGTGVTVTCLMPGATETDFFERADMLDTNVGTKKKDDPGDVAKVGFEAMMAGKGDVVSGWQNKLQSAIALIMPSSVLAERHRKMAAPGTAGR
jgi:short-subunit dehydrogenase